MKKNSSMMLFTSIVLAILFLAAMAPARQTASWKDKSCPVFMGSERPKIAVNQTLYLSSGGARTGSGQHIIVPMGGAKGGGEGLIYLFREAEGESYDFTTPEMITSNYTTDFDIDAPSGHDSGGLDQICLLMYKYESPNYKIKMMRRDAGPSPNNDWDYYGESDFHSSTYQLRHIDLVHNRHLGNRREAVWAEKHPSCYNQYRVFYKYYNGTAVCLNNISQPSYSIESWRPRIAVTTAGKLYVVWADFNVNTDVVSIRIRSREDGQDWVPPLDQAATLLASGLPIYSQNALDIALGPTGELYIVYGDDADTVGLYDLYFMKYEWWEGPTPGSRIPDQVVRPETPDLAVDSYGSVHLVYSTSGHEVPLQYQVFENGSWTPPSQIMQDGNIPSIDVDVEENIHVVCCMDVTNDGFLQYTRKRVWNKEDGGDDRWWPVWVPGSWSFKQGEIEWTENDFPAHFQYQSAMKIDQSTSVYWFWNFMDGDNWGWARTRCFVPSDTTLVFESSASAPGSGNDRLEFELRQFNDPEADLGKPLARFILGNRYPSPSWVGLPSGSGEGTPPFGLEYRNISENGQFIVPRFNHLIQSSLGGDDNVRLKKVWWRIQEQGNLELEEISITNVSDKEFPQNGGVIPVTINGTGFCEGNVMVQVHSKLQTVESSTSNQISFLLDTDDPDLIEYNTLQVINGESGVFTVWDELIHIDDTLPENDECYGAMDLSCGGSDNGALTQTATYSGISGCGDNLPDVWYTIEVPEADTLIEAVFAHGTTSGWVSIFTGSDCNNLVEEDCGLSISYSMPAKAYFVTTQDNQRLWIKIASNYYNPQSITVNCIIPSNDDCIGAREIACGQTIEGNLTLDATYSGVGTCGQSIPDVWYYAIVPHADTLIKATFVHGYSSGFVSFLTGPDCNNLTQQTCGFTISPYEPAETEWFTTEDNQKVWVKISSGFCDPQSLTVECTYPLNDECEGAEQLSCGVPVTGILTEGATHSGEGSCGPGTPDVWYYIDVPDAYTDLEASFVHGATAGFVSFHTGPDCDNLTEQSCGISISYNTPAVTTWQTMQPNQRVWVKIAASYYMGDQSIVVDCTPLPNTCNTAKQVSCGLLENGDMLHITENGESSCTETFEFIDRWFKFSPPQDYHVTITVSANNYIFHSTAVFKGTCASLQQVACYDPMDVEMNLEFDSEGCEYFIMLETEPGSSEFAEYNIEIECEEPPPPPNPNTCETAQQTQCGAHETGNMQGMTENGESSCTETFEFIDKWFKFTPPSERFVTITMDCPYSVFHSLAVFKGTCSSLQEVDCSGPEDVTITVEFESEGCEYYIMAETEPGSSEYAEYDIQIYCEK